MHDEFPERGIEMLAMPGPFMRPSRVGNSTERKRGGKWDAGEGVFLRGPRWLCYLTYLIRGRQSSYFSTVLGML